MFCGTVREREISEKKSEIGGFKYIESKRKLHIYKKKKIREEVRQCVRNQDACCSRGGGDHMLIFF